MEEKALEQTEVFRAIDGLRLLNDKLVLILKGEGCPDRGGCFVLSDDVVPPPRHFRLVSRVGEVAQEKAFQEYRLNAQEKASRLLVNHRDHATSWQSRNAENNKYGGAIRVNFSGIGLIMSFSGYSEQYDEALMLALAVKMGWLERNKAIILTNSTEATNCVLKLVEA